MKKSKGFTLVELVIVLAVLAILASVVTVNVSTVVSRGRITRIQADLKMLETAGNQFLYVQSVRTHWRGQELTQEQLLAGGYLSKTLQPPLAGYVYRLQVHDDGLVQATMENDTGVYHYGNFIADSASAQFDAWGYR